mmetsp:Transcript_95976/g.213648  ORF Transcript_95976/g.213648 Transcript_95976/m.213648 type:complete len:244 (+) Transcript_95976:63-794(+)
MLSGMAPPDALVEAGAGACSAMPRRPAVRTGLVMPRRIALAAAALLSGASELPCAAANSMYLAKLCRGHNCADASFPLVDYSEEDGACFCRAHPCWDDGGLKHACNQPGHPYLHFTYDEHQKLQCGCSSIPRVDSVHIAKDVCAGHRCEQPDHPILDYDEDQESCVCRSHPCWSDHGKKHSCDLPEFPILRYREDAAEDGSTLTRCECAIKFDAPASLGDANSYEGEINDNDDIEMDETEEEF